SRLYAGARRRRVLRRPHHPVQSRGRSRLWAARSAAARPPMSEIALAAAPKGRSLWQDAWRRLKRNRAAMAGLLILAVVALLAILLMVLFERSILLIFIAIGAVEWLDMARIVRGQAMALKRREFVEAARSLGVQGWTMIRRHIIPNTLGPVVVYATLTVPRVI